MPNHLGQQITYDDTHESYSVYQKYETLIQEMQPGVFSYGYELQPLVSENTAVRDFAKVNMQYLELRLLNAHLGWREMNAARLRMDCREDDVRSFL